jgi:lipopolysaccharide/colanic/teichoic acid biosynthesis glycosyltransferase
MPALDVDVEDLSAARILLAAGRPAAGGADPAPPPRGKRVFDVLAAAALLMACAPLIALAAALVRLGSEGPVLYRQARIGLRGRPFILYKLRSMRAGADCSPHRAHVQALIGGRDGARTPACGGWVKLDDDDPRITGVGRVLRRLGLDELPQLLNVLKGEMSLVGPRPGLPYEVEMYGEGHERRLAARPGITGLWQVYGRNRVSFAEMIRMDVEYTRRQSLWLDVSLLLLTPWAVLAGRGLLAGREVGREEHAEARGLQAR